MIESIFRPDFRRPTAMQQQSHCEQDRWYICRGPPCISLDSNWVLAEGGSEMERLSADWNDAIPAVVPGSVHTALLAAGRIPDPYVGKNDEIALQESFKTWWLMRQI